MQSFDNHLRPSDLIHDFVESGNASEDSGLIGPCLRLYDSAELIRHAENFETHCTDDMQRRRTSALLNTLNELGEYRSLKMLPWTWREDLDTLEDRFPHCAEIIDYVRISCALADRSTRVIELDNLLIEGEPGTGKSFFAEALAEFLNAGRVCIRMETAQSNSILCGSDAFWSNSSPGKVFEALALGTHANPTFLIDEVDKVSAEGRYDPLGPLYSLLEKSTANAFRDLCHNFIAINASKINWVATCNDSTKISAPLLTRMRHFVIEQPTRSQALSIATRIVDDVMTAYAPGTDGIQFSDAALAALAALSPRLMKQEARAAIGRVLYRQRGNVVLESDVAVKNVQRRGPGFL